MKDFYEALFRTDNKHLLKKFFKSKVYERALIRHLVRYAYYKAGVPYKDICKMEKEICGKAPHHTSVINSVKRIEDLVYKSLIATDNKQKQQDNESRNKR
jgi:hypothetical protein